MKKVDGDSVINAYGLLWGVLRKPFEERNGQNRSHPQAHRCFFGAWGSDKVGACSD